MTDTLVGATRFSAMRSVVVNSAHPPSLVRIALLLGVLPNGVSLRIESLSLNQSFSV